MKIYFYYRLIKININIDINLRKMKINFILLLDKKKINKSNQLINHIYHYIKQTKKKKTFPCTYNETNINQNHRKIGSNFQVKQTN